MYISHSCKKLANPTAKFKLLSQRPKGKVPQVPLHSGKHFCIGVIMNELKEVILDIYPCGCSSNQCFELLTRKSKSNRNVAILKCTNCCMNTGFQPTIDRAVKVWNECLTANQDDLFEDIAPLVVQIVKG
jgi:hypothetical protein